MKRERRGEERDEGIVGACSIGEHTYCHGNIDLKPGHGPAMALFRCACPCHRGRVRVVES